MDAPDCSTRTLLKRWHGGDQEALNALIARDLEWVHARVHLRLGPLLRKKGQTEDYVQEAMLHVLRYAPRFVVSSKEEFRALVARIVENVLRDESDRYRAARRDAQRERALATDSVIDFDGAGQSVTRPSEVAEKHEREAWVRMALELLEQDDREVILLREFDGLSFAQVGERLSVSEDGARMRFTRALPRLAEKVQVLRSGGLSKAL